MREIKFKIWDKDCKKIITNTDYKEFVINMQGQAYIINGYFDNAKVDEYSGVEIMQYTGLKDSKGKEIYEGDIIEISLFNLKKGDYTRKSEVHFLDGSFCIYTDDWFSQPLSDDIAKECKVIGNIYENSELLK